MDMEHHSRSYRTQHDIRLFRRFLNLLEEYDRSRYDEKWSFWPVLSMEVVVNKPKIVILAIVALILAGVTFLMTEPASSKVPLETALIRSHPLVMSHALPSLSDGEYTAYMIIPMVDPDSRKPVYWIVGGKGSREKNDAGMDVYIDPKNITLESIEVSRFSTFPKEDLQKPGGAQGDYRIIVEGGVATLKKP